MLRSHAFATFVDEVSKWFCTNRYTAIRGLLHQFGLQCRIRRPHTGSLSRVNVTTRKKIVNRQQAHSGFAIS